MNPLGKPFICFGEILWDCLPAGIFLGGAPLNVAYHLRQQGADVAMISAVGADFLGKEARRRIQAWGVNGSKIIERPHETGRVIATLDARGSARYAIEPDSAWDYLAPELPMPSPQAIVFGTLALRRPNNRRTLEQIFARSPISLRVLDLNLRAPFDREPVIEWALARAQWLKLNDTELRRVCAGMKRFSLERGARMLAARYRLESVCVTAGSRGAGLLQADAWCWEEARPVSVVDTIGAGDAFLGALLAAQLGRGEDGRAALSKACRLAEFVTARAGATPRYAVDRLGQIRGM